MPRERSRIRWWGLAMGAGLLSGAAVAQQWVDEAAVLQSPNAEWLTYGGDYAERHYSPLNQIDASNVHRLGLAWQWEVTGTAGALEATPLVADGVLYGTGTWSDVFALDAATGELIWRWNAGIVRGGVENGGPSICCGPVNRGVALWGDKVFVGLLDGRLVALNRDTGYVEWAVQTTPIGADYSITGAPRVVKDKVVIGNSGAEFGVRGFVTAYDAETGEQAWRFYTVPGNPADGFENEAMREAARTWSGEWWTMGGGGTVWDGFAYDPELNLLYVGTGNGSPWSRDLRSPLGGDNLYLASILAIDPDDGELEWYYQTTPGDDWDYTAVQPMMLLDLEIDGRQRRVIVQAPKNGFFYVLDRATGALISAEQFVDTVTWATGIDQETGRPIENPAARYTRESGGGVWVSPGPGGGHNWHPMAYNPDTGWVYFSAENSQSFYSVNTEFEYRPGRTNTGTAGRGAERPEPPELGGPVGMFLAWDPVSNSEVWRVERQGAGRGGTLSTGGDLVFRSDSSTIFAHDAATGEQLWSAYLDGPLASPISYMIDGRQYIAILAGGSAGRGVPTAPGRVWAFTLDGEPVAAAAPPEEPEEDEDD